MNAGTGAVELNTCEQEKLFGYGASLLSCQNKVK